MAQASLTPVPPLLALAGPTASGKSALAMAICAELAAHGWRAEIVSVDSAQIYRGMDIGTAKPDAAARAAVPHHLLDILDPADSYSAAQFALDARRLIAEIRARGAIPVLVGGTMLYYRALFDGLSALPSADPAWRAALDLEAQTLGWPALHARLAQCDPATAARLHPNDAQRVGRALEIYALTGRPASAEYAQHRALPSLAPLLRVALLVEDRECLHARIAQRFAEMLAAGFVEEVAALHARPDLHSALPAVRAVGYRQILAYLSGHCSREQALEKALAATRQYAKRQMTWLRAEKDWHFLSFSNVDDATAATLVRELLARAAVCATAQGPITME